MYKKLRAAVEKTAGRKMCAQQTSTICQKIYVRKQE